MMRDGRSIGCAGRRLGGSGDYAHATTLAGKESALLQGKL
jgi:hypothetical protein